MAGQKKYLLLPNITADKIKNLLKSGKRSDGRGLTDYRKLTVEVGTVPKAEGSALVKLGESYVIAGIKVDLGTPFPDTPDKGVLVVNAEVLPVASFYAEPGPPDEDAIELSRVIDRGVRESEMIDLSKLVLIPGQKVYTVFADVSVLNVDGNLFDAASYAVVSALSQARIPEYAVDGQGNIEATGNRIPLPITTLPISVTTAKIGDSLLVDPTGEEEAIMDARLTLTCDEEGHFCAGQKGGAGTFTKNELLRIAEIAREKSEEIRAQLRAMIQVAKGYT